MLHAMSVEMTKMKPTLSLGEEDLPEIKDWKVGGKYTITLEVEQTELSKPEVYTGKEEPKFRARFNILSAKVSKSEPKEEEEEEDDDMEEEEEDKEDKTKKAFSNKMEKEY